MASRICREELQQEISGIKNPPRRNTARNYQWRQESAEKAQKKKNGVKTPAKKKSSPGGGVVFETLGPALVVFERAVEVRCWK